jgi:ubiquinone/menaquinone biosynthesis C-methylase UbiE
MARFAESRVESPPFSATIRAKELFMQAQAIGKGYKGIGMTGPIARWYAVQTAKSMEDFKKLACQVAQQVEPDSRILEVAPGPGYFAVEIAKLGYRVTGLDISPTMVEIATRNASEAGVRVKFRQGNASNMPFEPEMFDFVLCRAAFKNFSEPARAIEEMYRVLKPGGRARIIDLRRDASMEDVNHQIEAMHLRPVDAFITRLTFRFMLLKRAYTAAEIRELAAQTSFKSATIDEGGIGLDINLAKPPC